MKEALSKTFFMYSYPSQINTSKLLPLVFDVLHVYTLVHGTSVIRELL